MSSHEDITVWYTLSSIFSGFLGFAMCVTFFVGAFIVRRTRPDAFGLLVASAAIQMGNLFLGHGLSFAVSAFAKGSSSHAGMDTVATIARLTFFSHAFTSVVFVIGNILLFAGILRLAKPPVVGNAFAEGRYA
jgi:hypothetical protein